MSQTSLAVAVRDGAHAAREQALGVGEVGSRSASYLIRASRGAARALVQDESRDNGCIRVQAGAFSR